MAGQTHPVRRAGTSEDCERVDSGKVVRKNERETHVKWKRDCVRIEDERIPWEGGVTLTSGLLVSLGDSRCPAAPPVGTATELARELYKIATSHSFSTHKPSFHGEANPSQRESVSSLVQSMLGLPRAPS